MACSNNVIVFLVLAIIICRLNSSEQHINNASCISALMDSAVIGPTRNVREPLLKNLTFGVSNFGGKVKNWVLSRKVRDIDSVNVSSSVLDNTMTKTNQQELSTI